MTVYWVGLAWPEAAELVVGASTQAGDVPTTVVSLPSPDGAAQAAGRVAWAVAVLAPPAEANPLAWIEAWRTKAPAGPMVLVLDPSQEVLGSALLRRGADDFLVRADEQAGVVPGVVARAAARWLGRDDTSWRRLLESQVDGLLILHPDGRVRYASLAAETLLGCAPGELLGQWLPWSVTPGVAHEVVIVRGMASSGVLEAWSAEAVHEGDPVLLVALRDVTAQRQADRALREAEANFRGIFENAVEGVFRTTADGRFVAANPALARMYGYPDPSAMIAEVADTAQQLYIDPARRARFVETALAGGQVMDFEAEVQRRDGQRLWVSETARPVYDNNGDLLYFEGFCQDITPRKQAERALEYRVALERLVAGVSADLAQRSAGDLEAGVAAALAAVGEFLTAERSFCYYYGEDSQRPERCQAWYAPDVADALPAPGELRPEDLPWLTECLAAGAAVAFATLDELPPAAVEDRAWFARQGVTAGLCVPLVCAGQSFGFLGVDRLHEGRGWTADDHGLLRTVSDLVASALERQRADAERWRLEAQVRHSQKLESLGVLAGGIAHDFNNLLVGILGNAGLAQEHLAPGSPARDFVDHIRVAAQRAAELTNQLLAYSGKGRFVTARFSLSTVVGELSQLLESAISRKVGLRLRLDDRLPLMEGDPSQIRQVVMNLITNASDALGDRAGTIEVDTSVLVADAETWTKGWLADPLPAGEYVLLRVVDAGCGMDEQTVARIFDPFFSTKFAGRGLGLAAVQGIVRGHHGAIRVTTAPGAGTTVEACFPALASEPVVTAPLPPLVEAGFRPALVLVVDDEAPVRDVACQILTLGGYGVREAASGPEALALLDQSREPFDLVLLDLSMPQMDGSEVFAELRARWPRLHILLTSGYTEQEAVGHETFGEGLSGFIQKPYMPRDLIAKVRQVLSGPHGGLREVP